MLSTSLSSSLFVPRVFCCVCVVHIHCSSCSQFDPRGLKYIFLVFFLSSSSSSFFFLYILGVFAKSKGYRCYHPPMWKHFVSIWM
jgi:hypothetical protein